MKILTLGSINMDYTYSVGHITTPQETQASASMKIFPGGKGLNQAITLARAGANVQLAGMIGSDGVDILEQIKESGVDTSLVRVVEGRTGHAIIQVDEVGQNAILLYGGANQKIDHAYIDEILTDYEKGDVIVLQNEVSCLDYAIGQAYEKGMFIVLNPSPCTRELLTCHLEKVSLFCLNEVEGRAMTSFVQPGDILICLQEKFPDIEFVFTLGADGAFYKKGDNQCYHPAVATNVVDATAAGDVFEGYFLATYLKGKSPTEALRYATYAASIAITRPGAAYYCAPTKNEVKSFVQKEEQRLDL